MAGGQRRQRRPGGQGAQRSVPRTALQPATVVVARVGYLNGSGHKARPAVVLDADKWEVRALPVGSGEPRSPYRRILAWDKAGLSRPSWMRLSATRVDRREVLDILGRLAAIDRGAVAAYGLLTDDDARAVYLAELTRQAEALLGGSLDDFGLTTEDLLHSRP